MLVSILHAYFQQKRSWAKREIEPEENSAQREKVEGKKVTGK